MRMNIYSVFDLASGIYLRPFFTQADGEAMRAFKDMTLDAEHPIGKHPEDYSLFRLGHYDDNKGKVVGEAPECLATALEMVAASRKVDAGKLKAIDDELKVGGTA